MKISVVIPTYRRPADLIRGLASFAQQERLPEEILVVVRVCDRDTHTALGMAEADTSLPAVIRQRLKRVSVTAGGQVAALNAGLKAAHGDIIAITDDDTIPHPHWLAKIEQHFLADQRVGGVGGRDWLYFNQVLQTGERSTVGRLRWFGGRVGNHHLGVGKARPVEILKGANMSYRRQAIDGLRFNERLRGSGAQVHNDLAFSLTVKKAGWQLIYDPEVSIDHWAGSRFDEDQRHQFNRSAFSNAVHNETLALLNYLPALNRLFFGLWAVSVGNRQAFGLVQLLRFFPQEGRLAWQKWWLTIQGRWQGYCTWVYSNRTSCRQCRLQESRCESHCAPCRWE